MKSFLGVTHNGKFESLNADLNNEIVTLASSFISLKPYVPMFF